MLQHPAGTPPEWTPVPPVPPDGSNDVVHQYLREIGRIPLLTADQEVTLATGAQQGDRDATHALIRANLRLVVSIARRHLNSGLSLEDLIQEGNLGLMRAVRGFDPTRGYRFSTYATWWIRQAVRRVIQQTGRSVRLPAHLEEKLSRLHRTERDLAQELGRDPTPAEVAQRLKLPASRVEYMLEVARDALSIDMPVGEDESTLGDFVEDTSSERPEPLAEADMLTADLSRALEQLSHREQEVLVLRFGLKGNRVRTMKEVGEYLGVTRERVRQIERQALNRLRLDAAAGLQEYLD